MTRRIDRRSFLKESSGAALGATAVTLLGSSQAEAASERAFRSAWPGQAERPWPGPEYWANPLQDWGIRDGRLECRSPGGDRNVFLLTREIAGRAGTFVMSVRLGRLKGKTSKLERGFVGFRVGIKSFVDDYRARAVHGRGMDAGVTADGQIFIANVRASAPRANLDRDLRLELRARPSGAGYAVTLRASGRDGETETTRKVAGAWLEGGVALACSPGNIEPTAQPLGQLTGYTFYPPGQERGGTMRFWFADWTLDGSKIDVHEERAYGPILFTLYTLSRGTLKLSAQFPPLGNAPKTVRLQLRKRGESLEDGGDRRTRRRCVECRLPCLLMGRYEGSCVPDSLRMAERG
jgi:alkaline phosphatase D